MKNQKTILFIIFSCLIASAQDTTLDGLLSKYNKGDVSYMSVEELKMKHLNSAIFILDAREQIEYEVSHLPDAIFVGYSNFSEEEFSQKFKDKSIPIVVYCSIGIRSENIAKKLLKSGYTNISNLYGGIFEWKNKGFTLVDSKGNETEKVHVYSKQWSKWLKKGQKIY